MPSFKCKRNSKDKLGRRIHEYVLRKDGEGREFKICERCSHVQVNVTTENRRFNEE